MRALLVNILERAGYTVIEAANGREALVQIETRHVDLVIMDLLMPDQDGLETIRFVHRNHPHLKMIAISGADEDNYLHMAALMGAHATLQKPFLRDPLLSEVRRLLALKPLEQ